MRSPYQVVLSCEERSELESLSRRASAQCRQVLRARIVLAAADGTSTPPSPSGSISVSTRSGSGVVDSATVGSTGYVISALWAAA